MQTNLNVTSLDGENNKSTKAITFVNSNSTNAQLKTLAQKFTAISSNTYQDAERINRMSVEEPYTPPPAPKLTATLSMDLGEKSTTEIQGQQNIAIKTLNITYDGDGQVYVKSPSQCYLSFNESEMTLKIIPMNTPEEGFATIIQLYASEGTNYAATSKSARLTW